MCEQHTHMRRASVLYRYNNIHGIKNNIIYYNYILVGGGWESKHFKQVLYTKKKYINFLKNGTWPACVDEKKAGINLTPTWFG